MDLKNRKYRNNMKRTLFFLLLFTITTTSKAQALFGIDIYTQPKFVEDSLLNDTQNRKVFKQKLKKLLKYKLETYPEDPFAYDTIKRAFITFQIDSTGLATYKDEHPQGSFKAEFIGFFKEIVDSLPRFIPAKERNRNTKIYYTLPIFNPEYLKKEKEKTN